MKRVGWIIVALSGCYAGADDGGGADGTDGGQTEGSSPSGANGPGGDPSGDPSGPSSGPSGGPGSATTGDTDDPTTASGETTDGPPVTGPLLDRLDVADVTVPNGARAGVSNWRIWGRGSLHVAPVFSVPLANCETLVGYSSDSGAHAVHLDRNDELVQVLDLGAGVELRGMAGEADAHFGALLWNEGAQQIHVHRFDLDGAELWSTQLVNADNTPTDFGIGDSRLEWGGGSYGAYYHVHSDSGHEGDTLKWVSDAGVESTEWGWGCSHSMSNVLRWNDALASFMPACVTDCYPGTSGGDFATQAIGGIYVDHNAGKVIDVDAGCNGDVAGELGGAALAPDGWKLVFNAHQAPATLGQNSYNPATMNQDIGYAPVGSTFTPGGVVWLTNTEGENEDDGTIARWQPSDDDAEQYVVGWHEPTAGVWRLGRIDPAGAFLEGPVDVSAVAKWGRRDDPFRQHRGADVVWAWFDDPGSTTLRFARLDAGASAECESF